LRKRITKIKNLRILGAEQKSTTYSPHRQKEKANPTQADGQGNQARGRGVE